MNFVHVCVAKKLSLLILNQINRYICWRSLNTSEKRLLEIHYLISAFDQITLNDLTSNHLFVRELELKMCISYLIIKYAFKYWYFFFFRNFFTFSLLFIT